MPYLNYTVVLVPMRRHGNQYEFLVMDVTRPGEDSEVKFLVEKCERVDDGQPYLTVRRGAFEELNLEFRAPMKMTYLGGLGHLRGRLGFHNKLFFGVWRTALKGKIREEPKYEASGTLLGVPRWATYRELAGLEPGKKPLHWSQTLVLEEYGRMLEQAPRLQVA